MVPALLLAAPYGADEPGEVGDLVFRTSKDGKMFGVNVFGSDVYTGIFGASGHVALYVGLENTGQENPPKRLVEALGWNALSPFGADTGVFATIYDKTTHQAGYFLKDATFEFEGARTVTSATPEQRRNVVLLALDQVGEGYDENGQQQKGPGPNDWICTGLVEKVYESSNLNGATLDGGDGYPLQYSTNAYAIDIMPDGAQNNGSNPANLVEKTRFTSFLPGISDVSIAISQPGLAWILLVSKDVYMPATMMRYSSQLSNSTAIPPPAPINLNASPSGSTTNNSFTINWTNPSDLSGIYGAYYKLGSPPTSDSDYIAFTSTKPFTISASVEGGQKVYVWLKDKAGNSSYLNANYTWLYYDPVTNDGLPPTGSININSGASETSSLAVTLSLNASDRMSTGAQMRFGVVNWCPSSVPYSTSYSFDLSSCGGNTSEGSKTVYVQFIDADGKWSSIYSDTIEYKPTTPGNDSCVAATLPSGAQSATVWVNDEPPYGDTFLYSYHPTSNYYDDPDYNNWVGVDEYPVGTFSKMRTLLKANFDAIPPGATIIDAKLKLEMHDSYIDNNPTVFAHKLTCNSNLETVNWNSRPGSGCMASPESNISVTSADDVACLNLTSAVQSWINSSSPNYGVILKTNEASTDDNVGFGVAGDHSPRFKVQYYSNNTAPTLAFTGESDYTSDGLNTESGSSATSFIFRVKYSDPEGYAPGTGYPKVHILKDGSEISGSPYSMTAADANPYTSGMKFTFTKTGLASGNYIYFFEAYDKYGMLASGAATTPISAPEINEPPVLGWSGETNYTNTGVYPTSGTLATQFFYRIKYTDPDNEEPWPGYPLVHVLKGGAELSGSPFIMSAVDNANFSSGRIYTRPISGLQEGADYTYYFEARDERGTAATLISSQDGPSVDNTPPTVPDVTSSHSLNVYNTTNNSPQFNWTSSDASGIAGYNYVLDSYPTNTPEPGSGLSGNTTTFLNIPDGIWYFHIRAKDTLDNWSDTATYGPIKIDLTAPTFLSIVSSSNPAKAGAVSVNITASEAMNTVAATIAQNGKAPVSVSLTSQDNIVWSGTGSVVPGYDGTATITVSGNDLAGKTGSGSATFTVDTSSPSKPVVSSLTHTASTPTSKNLAGFTWTASSDDGGIGVAGYSYVLNQTEMFTVDFTTETVLAAYSSQLLADGTYWFHVGALDNAGNLSATDSYKFIVDTTSPTLTSVAAPSLATIGNVTIAVNSNENIAGTPVVTVLQNGQGAATPVVINETAVNTWQGVYAVVGGFDGTAIINVSGSDLASNTTTQTSTFQIDTIGPSASIALSPPAPLRSGVFNVAVTLQDASAVLQAPQITLALSNGATMSIFLTGVDKNWQGSGFIYSAVSTGTATVSFSVADELGNIGTTVTSGGSFHIDTSVNGTAGGAIYNTDGTSVITPPNIYSGSMTLLIEIPDPLLGKIIAANNNSSEVIPVGAVNLSREFSAKDSNTQTAVTNFALPVTIKIPYPDANNDGIVDGTNIKEGRLSIFWLNESISKWEEVVQTTPDYVQNIFSASVYHFSIYSLLANAASDLSSVRVYPVPWTPGSGNQYDTPSGGCGQGLQIDNLTSDAKISIYNLPGDLVRKLRVEPADNGCKAWDGKNEAGRKVVSGVYIAVIEGTFGKKVVKKLVIER